MMRIETVDLHHQVLTAWASYRSTLAEAPAVVTFDHHTDTLPAFGRAPPMKRSAGNGSRRSTSANRRR